MFGRTLVRAAALGVLLLGVASAARAQLTVAAASDHAIRVRSNRHVDVSRGMSSFSDATFARIAIANPQHAPYGRAAVAALQKSGAYGRVEDHLDSTGAVIDWQAIALSVRLSTMVAVILLVAGIPLAWWLTFRRRRWTFLIEAVVALPLVLPPTVLGFYLLVAMGPSTLLGRSWQAMTGHGLAFTFDALVMASILYSLPFVVQPIAAGFAQIDRTLLDAAATLGASTWRTFTRIVIPLGRDGILAGAVLGFAHTLGEFGVVLMVGGNLPGVTRTVSISIYDQVQAFDRNSANATALLLLGVSFGTLALVYALLRRPWAVAAV
jgi:molybdate transport system permease protein